jgi:hypothetical protein
VLALLGLLAGLAVPALSGLGASRQALAATRVRAALVHARALAVHGGARSWVVFERPSDHVRVLIEDRSRPGRANRRPVLDPLSRGPLVVALRELDSGIAALSFEAGDEIGFDPMGVPLASTGSAFSLDATVALVGGATVRVTRNTGRVGLE